MNVAAHQKEHIKEAGEEATNVGWTDCCPFKVVPTAVRKKMIGCGKCPG